MKTMILSMTLLFSFSVSAQEEKKSITYELGKKIKAREERPTPAELIKQIQSRDKKETLDGCEMSVNGKEITCGDKVYEISGKVNDIERIHHKLDKLKDESSPKSKSQKASHQ